MLLNEAQRVESDAGVLSIGGEDDEHLPAFHLFEISHLDQVNTLNAILTSKERSAGGCSSTSAHELTFAIPQLQRREAIAQP